MKYVKEKQAQGELIFPVIIPEGELRHILNIGLTIWSQQQKIGITPENLFSQEDYINYLNNLLTELERRCEEMDNRDTKLYNEQTTDEFIETMLLNMTASKQTIRQKMDENVKKGKDNIDEAFANLRISAMEDMLNFIKNHKTMTDKDLDDFVEKKILDLD